MMGSRLHLQGRVLQRAWHQQLRLKSCLCMRWGLKCGLPSARHSVCVCLICLWPPAGAV